MAEEKSSRRPYVQLGFDGASEFHRMVANVDLVAPGAMAAFERWKQEDGTKRGLRELEGGGGGD